MAAHARAQRQKWVDGLRAARLAEREREDDEEAARVVAEEERKRDETVSAVGDVRHAVPGAWDCHLA